MGLEHDFGALEGVFLPVSLPGTECRRSAKGQGEKGLP